MDVDLFQPILFWRASLSYPVLSLLGVFVIYAIPYRHYRFAIHPIFWVYYADLCCIVGEVFFLSDHCNCFQVGNCFYGMTVVGPSTTVVSSAVVPGNIGVADSGVAIDRAAAASNFVDIDSVGVIDKAADSSRETLLDRNFTRTVFLVVFGHMVIDSILLYVVGSAFPLPFSVAVGCMLDCGLTGSSYWLDYYHVGCFFDSCLLDCYAN